MVTVVGAGVSGLVTALALAEDAHAVEIVAAEWGERTTSAVAAALWLPYLCEPPDRVLAWSLATYRWLAALAESTPRAGVDMLTLYETDESDEPWWRPAVPPEVPVERVAAGPMAADRPAWRVRAPRVEPALFMPWITERLRERGVPMREARVESLGSIEADLVINCSGLGSRRLCRDESMQARFGQVVLVEAGAWDRSVVTADDRGGPRYVVPRRGEVVVGGWNVAHEPEAPAEVSESVTAQILARVEGLPIGPVLRARAGLRPWRSSVRLEREGRVIHNYGHGGAGWTLSWGCAQEVVRLARDLRV